MGLAQLSDDELIQIFLQTHPSHGGNEAFATLWQRYAAFVEYLVQRLTNRLPHGDDRPTFVDEARQRARLYLLRALPRYQGPEHCKAYLAKVVRSATIDQSRAVQGRRAREYPAGDMQSLDTAGATPSAERDDVPFRSRHAFPVPFNLIAQQERRQIISLALDLHGQQSDRHARSTRAIRWRYWDDQSSVDIAGTLRLTERTVYRLLHEDFQELRSLLKHHFGIEHISQI